MENEPKPSEIPPQIPEISAPAPFILSPTPAKRYPAKRTRDLPDIFYCHSCGHRFPSDGPIDRLFPLPSQWRVVLLCSTCVGIVTSGSSCSYCFSTLLPPEPENSLGIRVCRRCRCRVHLSCVPHQRGYVSLAELDPDLFTCIDCCAVPKFKYRSSSFAFSRFSLEDLVRDAEKKAEAAVRAKEKAIKKGAVAKFAAEETRDAFDAVLLTKEPQKIVGEEVLNDEELALQLHLEMNGSQRLARNFRPRNSSGFSDAKRAPSDGKCSDSGNNEVCAKVEFCSEDKKFFESVENFELGCEKREQEDIVESRENGTSMITVKVEWEASSNMATGDERSGGSNGIVAPPQGSGNAGEDFAESQQKERCDSPERYLKKYSKRHSKGIVDKKDSQLASCRQISCSDACRTSSGGQLHTIPIHSSFESNFSGCQS